MNRLVIFDDTHCIELSEKAAPSSLLGKSHGLDGLVMEKSFTGQLNLSPNAPSVLEQGFTVLLSKATPQYLSTFGLEQVRVGASSNDHIRLMDTIGSFAFCDEALLIFDSTDMYINGRKACCGEYPLVVGDCIWIGTTRLVMRRGHVECTGTRYVSNLNISTNNPERYDEFPIYKRSPRIIKREPAETVDIAEPKAKETQKKGALIKRIIPPLAMLLIMVGGSILMGRGIFVLISGAGMLVTLVFTVTSFFGDRKEQRNKEREQDEQYENYLLQKRKQINSLYETQREALLYHNLSPQEISQEILSYSSRVYERAANDSDFLNLSLGYATVPTSFTVNYKETTELGVKDSLADEMRSLGTAYKSVPDMPTVIDLKNAHLGLVGEKPHIHRALSSILVQLCFFQSYHDVEIIILTEEEDYPQFEWARWYPHCRIKSINVSGLVSVENQRDQVLGNVSQVLKMRKQKQDEEKKDSRYLPHYIFLIDNPKLIINHSIMEYLQTPETSLGFSVIYTTHIQANLPEYIKTVFLLTGGDNGTLLLNEGQLKNCPVTLPSMDGIDLETITRKLAPLHHIQGVTTQIPETVTFFELYGVKRPDEIPVLNLWRTNACHKSLAVPLGLRGKDDVVSLNLHEKAHGPHGLVAGTTGSGKSEIVQSYILSLAANFHPHEVGFLLIDYKGGGMANLFEKLPHLLGTITNLDGSESMRALTSIQSELKRRQRIFGEVGVNSINQYSKLFKSGEATLPLPHLFIISDEFAELKKEQPEFMAELVSTARIGRSLGVHLILATQKPTGVVDDQIWSNSKFKLALKVANEADSNEVLKTPDAARITQPGRAYLQVGNNEIYELFQSAWSGALYSEDVVERGFDGRVYLINQLGQGVLLNEDLSIVDATQDSNLTQLDVMVNHINELYKGLGAIEVEKPWLPSLPLQMVTPDVQTGKDIGTISKYNLEVPLGMVDIPEEQTQIEYIHSFPNDGNLLVVGAPGFGKSTALMTTALTMACQNSPSLLNYFVLDYGNSALAQLRGLPHTADYLSLDDAEKLEKLLKLLTETLKERKHLFAAVNAMNFRMYNEVAAEKLPAIILFIDNGDVLREISPELEEFLAKLTRDGTGVGIYTAMTISRPGAIRYSILNNFKNRIALFMPDKADVTTLVGKSNYALPEVRGRALVKLKETHVAQCYLPVPFEDDISYANLVGEAIRDIATRNTAPKATGLPVVAETISYADLMPYLKTKELQAVVGFDTESTEPLYFDLSIPSHLIVGGPLTGKTNILKLLLTQFEGSKCFVSDSKSEDLYEFNEKPGVVYMSTEDQLENFFQQLSDEVAAREEALENSDLRARDFIAALPPVLILIDDFDNFVELCKSKIAEMEKLLPSATTLGISIFITTLGTKMRGYDNLSKLYRESQAGLVLGNPAEQQLLPVQVARGVKPLPNMGFWFKRGNTRQVKMPFMT